MTDNRSPGLRFRNLVAESEPLQIVGTINANAAIIAKKKGLRAIYISGGGVAAGSLGIPDLGITTLHDVVTDCLRITNVCDLPLLVDIDTGWGGVFNITRCIKEMIRVGVAAVHIEDQITEKRCGHRPNKELVSSEEMCDRIKAATDARQDPDFVIMSRTDSLAKEGINSAIDRACEYAEAGADMIFPEAIVSLNQYTAFKNAVKIPILANITEFGKTPLFSKEELGKAGVDMILYPLSAFRAMCKVAEFVYESILQEGSQKNVIDAMQTREELYAMINYHKYEKQLDSFTDSKKKKL